MDLLLARRSWLGLAAVVIGVAVGLIVSLLGSTSRRAEAAVLVSSPRGPAAVRPFLPNLRELATSSVLAGNVRTTLRLRSSVEDVRDHLHASIRPESQVIVLAATDAHADKARQVAQEAALVFTQLVANRFSDATPPLQAAVLDAAHALSAPNRHFVRNALIGAAAGLVLGAAGALLLGGGVGGLPAGVSAAAARDLRRRESQLAQRIKTVSARERELAARVGMLAVRERQLEATPLQPPQPAPRPEPGLEAAPAPTIATPSGAGGWNVNELERFVQAQRDATPEALEEWRTYLFFLREHAEIDGRLPSQFDSLVEEVFGDLIRR